jgi:3-oxoacyl-[acyl-carrier-protein] synthase-3
MNDPVRPPCASAAVGLRERIGPSTTPPANDTRAPRFKNPRAAHSFRLRTCSIAALGSYVPDRVLTNVELAKQLGTTEEWIFRRTGISERRIAGDGECASDMAAKAALRAMAKAGVTAEQIELIIAATNTPDMVFPATACIVQSKLGVRRTPAFDIKAAGSGFIYALEVAQQFITSQSCDTVLVVGTEKLSAMVDWEDRDTSVLFGDGAGAAILRSIPNRQGLLTTCMGGNGDRADLLFVPGGGSQEPASTQTVAARHHFLHMAGREIFKQAVHATHNAALEALARCQLSIRDINCIIPHQSNKRIIDSVTERLGARPEQVFTNLHKYGNTSGAAVALALDEAIECGRVQRGDLVLLLAFGAGLTWAAAVIEW